MRTIQSVEDAKTLLHEAKEWGVWRWMTEKKRVRAAADLAWADLEKVEMAIKSSWSDDLRHAYRELQLESSLNGNRKGREAYEKAVEAAKNIDAEMKVFAARLKKEDDEAFQARMTAEETFDQAERKMSVSLARQGSEQAIEAYDLREKYIRKAEAAKKK
jgi:flavodoxin